MPVGQNGWRRLQGCTPIASHNSQAFDHAPWTHHFEWCVAGRLRRVQEHGIGIGVPSGFGKPAPAEKPATMMKTHAMVGSGAAIGLRASPTASRTVEGRTPFSTRRCLNASYIDTRA